MKPFHAKSTRICELCGKEFIPETRNQRCCKDTHYRSCPVCGSQIVVKYRSDPVRCCSKSCSSKLRSFTCMDRYSVSNPAKLEEFELKKERTNLQKYGVSTPFLMDDFSQKAQETSLNRYGCRFPMQNKEVQEKHRTTCMQRSGQLEPTTLPKVRDALLNAYKDPERLQLAAKKRSKNSKYISSDGVHLDSRYELLVYDAFRELELTVSRNYSIPFLDDGSTRHVLIDFKLGDILVECKGGHLLDGVYDHAKNMIPIKKKLEVYQENNVVIVTDSYGSRILESSCNKFINIEDYIEDNKLNAEKFLHSLQQII